MLIIFFLASRADDKSIRLLQDGDRFKLCQFLHVEEGQLYWRGGYIVVGLLELGLIPSLPCPQTNLRYLDPPVSTLKTCQIFFSLNTKDYIYRKVPTSLYRAQPYIFCGSWPRYHHYLTGFRVREGPKMFGTFGDFQHLPLANRPCDTGTSSPGK